MAEHHRTPAVHSTLAFTRPEDVRSVDADGVGRACTLEPDALHDGEAFVHHALQIRDCAAPGAVAPELHREGFARADLTGVRGLGAVLERARRADRLDDDDVAAIRSAMAGASVPLGPRHRLRVLYVAPEGLIMRRAGPDHLRVTASATASGANDHDAAVSVHADQDVHGTPVRQILRGTAPWLFRHRAPTSSNTWSPLVLVNVWVPLQQAVRPLALMDRRTLDPRHQLRFDLATDDFLDRPPDRRVNHIWTFLHHPGQQWAFTSADGPEHAWVFDTLSTPHGAFVLPGEDRAAFLVRQLQRAREAMRRGHRDGLRPAPIPASLGVPVTSALRAAVSELGACLAAASPAFDTPATRDAWDARAGRALDSVVRKSIEMRVVGLVRPRFRRRERR